MKLSERGFLLILLVVFAVIMLMVIDKLVVVQREIKAMSPTHTALSSRPGDTLEPKSENQRAQKSHNPFSWLIPPPPPN